MPSGRNFVARELFSSKREQHAMDNQTKHEIWIVMATSLLPIPPVTAIAVIATLQ
jgi:uncharacterized membrane protein YdjX (TVP38/TMEM64 family)